MSVQSEIARVYSVSSHKHWLIRTSNPFTQMRWVLRVESCPNERIIVGMKNSLPVATFIFHLQWSFVFIVRCALRCFLLLKWDLLFLKCFSRFSNMILQGKRVKLLQLKKMFHSDGKCLQWKLMHRYYCHFFAHISTEAADWSFVRLLMNPSTQGDQRQGERHK